MADQFGREATVDGVRGHGNNFFLGLVAGLLAAILGAVLWMIVAVSLNLQAGLVAIAIGAMVGFAVRSAGNGPGPIFGVLGAVLTLLGCVGGEVLTELYRQSSTSGGLFEQIKHADLFTMVPTIFEHMKLLGYVIVACGVFEGYKFSMRRG